MHCNLLAAAPYAEEVRKGGGREGGREKIGEGRKGKSGGGVREKERGSKKNNTERREGEMKGRETKSSKHKIGKWDYTMAHQVQYVVIAIRRTENCHCVPQINI